TWGTCSVTTTASAGRRTCRWPRLRSSSRRSRPPAGPEASASGVVAPDQLIPSTSWSFTMSDRPRRRRRPGRRPPDRLSARFAPPPPRGFTGHGFGTYYNVLMPSLRGREKRAFFNKISGWLVAGFALGGVALGYAWLGPLGAAVGLGAGLMAGG